MGSCCGRGRAAANKDQPSPGTQRKQTAEAAEQRQKENDGKGIQDPEALKRKQKMMEAADRKADMGPQEEGLRWQVG